MPALPRAFWRLVEGEPCWTIDWRELFGAGLRDWHSSASGEMRGFHVVFRLRVLGSGTFAFWDDDGSIVRRNGDVVHEDRTTHGLRRSAITVGIGDLLEVAHWQDFGDWLWGARLVRADDRAVPPHELFRSYLDAVRTRMRNPNGPPLRMFTDARNPARAATAIYSMILNGYAPSRVLLFGGEQWSAEARTMLEAALPFAEMVDADDVRRQLHEVGGSALTRLAEKTWYVMKTCITLFCAPSEFCQMDDDVFVLGAVDDAVDQFRHHDLVYVPDVDHSPSYHAWQPVFDVPWPLRTGRFNAGLFWCRQLLERQALATRMLGTNPRKWESFHWEQGFIAAAYALRSTHQLPSQRYFYPLFDGLPGGVLDYDYERNPCGFASIHFGGMARKPTDEWMSYLAPAIFAGNRQHARSNGQRPGNVPDTSTMSVAG